MDQSHQGIRVHPSSEENTLRRAPSRSGQEFDVKMTTLIKLHHCAPLLIHVVREITGSFTAILVPR